MVTVRPIEPGDRPTVERLQIELWGAAYSVSHGIVFRPAELPGFLTLDGDEIVGMLTYVPPEDGTVEIVTVDALRRHQGIGTLLLNAVHTRAGSLGASCLVLTTTNDNVDALRFYQRRGFQLTALRPGQAHESRKLKPEFPLIGNYGIPITDELELTRAVTG
ncbi:MAG TPA: GNAT family N-acetyltransferase [Pseudonocardiaceae bacterium]